jgi:hypothetical protein
MLFKVYIEIDVSQTKELEIYGDMSHMVFLFLQHCWVPGCDRTRWALQDRSTGYEVKGPALFGGVASAWQVGQ